MFGSQPEFCALPPVNDHITMEMCVRDSILLSHCEVTPHLSQLSTLAPMTTGHRALSR